MSLTTQQAKPISNLNVINDKLSQIASKPLELCPDFPTIAKRFDAWWDNQMLDRPIFIANNNPNPARPITRRTDFLTDAKRWYEEKLADLDQIQTIGDAIPQVRVDLGPLMIGSLLGAETEFDPYTSWQEPFINDDWSNLPDWEIDPENKWWKILCQLLETVASQAHGKYLVGMPDVSGTVDILSNLRHPASLCMDTIEQPEKITPALQSLYHTWHHVLCHLYNVIVEKHSAGNLHWLAIWSNKPYDVITCDFNAMVGPDIFDSICLPFIAQQAATLPNAVFHLDGPDAARHVDSLIQTKEINAIQFTPGDGAPSVLPWIDMFKKIQAAGKPLFVFCPADEVVELCKSLNPQALAMRVTHFKDSDHINRVFDQFCKLYTPGS